MRVRLVDVDSAIPNLALMQVSAWHKQQGDEAGFDIAEPDKVYVSCVFAKNAEQARGLATLWPEADVVLGGSGLNREWLPAPMQMVKPDYDLYPSEYSLGFTTRGCVRRCPFCIVREKEGRLRRWQHVREFADERFGQVSLLDNNILGDRDWFFEQTDWLIAHKKKVDFVQGLDARLIDAEIAARLKELRHAHQIRFAWDNMADEAAVRRAIDLLNAARIRVRGAVSFFVLVGFDTTFDEDLYRCRKLKEWGANAFVMRYNQTPELNALARWANRKQIFWSVDFAEYTGNRKRQQVPLPV